MLKFRRKMAALAVSALMLGSGAAAGTTGLFSSPAVVSAAVSTWNAYDSNAYIVCPSGLNIRKGPGTNYARVAGVPSGKWVSVSMWSSNGWAKISYNGYTGWIYPNNNEYAITTSGGYFSPTYIKANSGLNMRKGPGTNFGIVSAIPKGSWVTTTRLSSNGWAYVSYGGKQGWIYLNNSQYAEIYLDFD